MLAYIYRYYTLDVYSVRSFA